MEKEYIKPQIEGIRKKYQKKYMNIFYGTGILAAMAFGYSIYEASTMVWSTFKYFSGTRIYF